jgi:protein O-mannosyl-transferase
VIVAAVLVAYSNSLAGPFILDDQGSVVQNSEIRDLARLDRVLMPSPNSPVAGRPLVSLSFALNYAAGGLDVTGYHVVNIACHLACALLLFGLVRRTLQLPSVQGRLGHAAPDLALAAALLWAVHPLNSEVVDYLTQRTESMMALCLLVTLYAAIRSAATRSRAAPARHWRALASPRRWHAVAIVACLLGTVCKETIAVAPLLVMLYDRCFLFDSWGDAWRARDRLYLGLAASWLVLGGLVMSGPRAAVGGFNAGVSAWTYLLNQAAVIVDYLRLSFWPSRLVVFYGWPEMLTLGDVWWQAAVVVGLLVLTLVALVRAPKLGYLGAWFFVILAPTSSLIPIATEVGAERRMYLPLMALAVLTVLAVGKAVDAVSGATMTRLIGTTALLLVSSTALAAGTVARNREYASPVTLARTVVERRPTAVAHHILGEQLGLARQDREAETELRAAAELGDTRARYPLGLLLFQSRRFGDAARELEGFVATSGVPQRLRWLEPPLHEVLSARLLLGQIFATDNRWVDAAAQMRLVLAAVPRHPEAQRVLGLAVFAQQQWPEAISIYRDYLALRPRDVQARTNLGVALVASGRLDDAVIEFRRATEADPSNANARRLLDLALADQRAESQ